MIRFDPSVPMLPTCPARWNPACGARCNKSSAVAEDAAGNNFDQHFTPRIGTEVVIDSARDEIDQPSILGQLLAASTPINSIS
jgi:hypothetical protein